MPLPLKHRLPRQEKGKFFLFHAFGAPEAHFFLPLQKIQATKNPNFSVRAHAKPSTNEVIFVCHLACA